ncbi:MAG: adenosylcobinamide kinase / adenosylcobinamide-phosphate guanylyltransferase [Halanaerobiales bacterium]|nr:adenosylcobinamide kinase / adenosylcobinamide-phosphate guanylyltransferase [Halanaerobiales bacterium]
MSKIILILGGARSGKSKFAEMVAWSKGGAEVIYLATSEVRDDEMEERIRKHRQTRPATWETVEEPYQVSRVLADLPAGRVVLLDCITVLISNLLLQGENVGIEEKEFEPAGKEPEVMQEIKAIIAAARKKKLDLILVSNEVGQGLIPMYKLGRQYRDIAGRVNQLLAETADEVYLCIAGLPVEIKEIGMKNLDKFSKQDNRKEKNR